jgi:hypothetical protein
VHQLLFLFLSQLNILNVCKLLVNIFLSLNVIFQDLVQTQHLSLLVPLNLLFSYLCLPYNLAATVKINGHDKKDGSGNHEGAGHCNYQLIIRFIFLLKFHGQFGLLYCFVDFANEIQLSFVYGW